MSATQLAAVNFAKTLRARATKNRRFAIATLLLVAAAMVVGVALFIYAAVITEGDQAVLRRIAEYEAQKISIDVDNIQKEFRRIAEELAFFEKLLPVKTALPGPATERATVTAEAAWHAQRFDSLRESVRRLLDMRLAATTAAPPDLNLSVLTTRLGAAVLLIFFVQLLVSLYRYFLKLANHYESRADALDYCASVSTATLAEALAFFSPDKVEVGAPEATPIDTVAGLLKAPKKDSVRGDA